VYRLPAFVLLLGVMSLGAIPAAEPPRVPDGRVEDVPYHVGDEASEYERTRCRLDLYLPPGPPPEGGFPCLVWFHGGGLKEGNKRAAPTEAVAAVLAEEGVAVAAADYRLSPRVRFPAYVEDAAAAVAWVHAHAGEHRIDPGRVFVGGHSAGAYLSLMLGVDGTYLRAEGPGPGDLAGVFAVSGQTVTHSTIREERGIGKTAVAADEAAPVYHAKADTPPLLLLYADADLPCRAEENALFAAAMTAAGNRGVRAVEVAGRDHGSVASKIAEAGDPARDAILRLVRGTPPGE